MYSYFGPVADKVVIDAGQFNRFRIISAQTLDQSLNGGVEIEDQAAGVSIPYHALQPEERRHAHTPGDRRHHMQARGRVKHEMASRQLDFVGTVEVLDHELAAVIFIR